MKASDRFWRVAGIPIIVLLVSACCCVSVGINSLGWFGDVVTAPLRWFNPGGDSDPNLHEMLSRGRSASFQVGENCSFTSARGSLVSSAGSNPSRDLDPDEVTTLAQQDLSSLTFQVSSGDLSLSPASQVEYELLMGDRVSIYAAQEGVAEGGTNTTSLNGVVQGQAFSGTYARSERITTVVGGQGQEEALDYQSDFTCPLVWLTP